MNERTSPRKYYLVLTLAKAIVIYVVEKEKEYGDTKMLLTLFSLPIYSLFETTLGLIYTRECNLFWE